MACPTVPKIQLESHTPSHTYTYTQILSLNKENSYQYPHIAILIHLLLVITSYIMVSGEIPVDI